MITYIIAIVSFLFIVGLLCLINYLYYKKKSPRAGFVVGVVGILFLLGSMNFIFNEIGIENKPVSSQIKTIEYSDTLEIPHTTVEKEEISIFQKGELATEKNTEENNKAKERFKNIK